MSAAPDRLVAGVIGDRYEITGLIATGGMGSVYRARDLVLERTVALKVLRTGGDDPDFVARFRTEATNAARLSHPNIVQVYDFGYADGSPFMAMEFIDGQTLREILQTKRALRPDVAARIAQQVASALEAARRVGIVHRDIKPENILITTDGVVKVADFGLSYALAEARATQAGMLFGTAHYLAPEQIEGGDVDHRADLYALGVVLFEMLTGRTPFSGDTPVVIAYKRVAEDVPSVLSLNADVPRELDVIVARATERDPAARYPTAAAMADALRDSAPRSDTDDLGALVHHTMAIPIAGEETIRVPLRAARAAAARRRRKGRLFVALGVAVAIAVVAITNGPLAKTSVPDVRGLSEASAKAELRERGFEVDTSVDNSATVARGEVISQTPAPPAALRKGAIVSIVVSIGPLLVGLPDVRGKPFAIAEQELRAEGFVVRREDVFDPEVPKLRVVRQDPSAGAFEEGTRVTLYVSKGPELVPVPDVRGRQEEAAVALLEDEGFVAAIRRVNDDAPVGRVIKQTPKPGVELAKGEEIVLVVSLGPPLVEVPRVLCQSRRKAQDTLLAEGFKVSFVSSGAVVVDQDPQPGTSAPKGSTVTLTLGSGAICG